MKRYNSAIYLALFLSLLATQAYCNGLEFRITFSGRLLLGVAYRHQINPNTAIRVGSYMGVSGAPVGLHLGIVQDISSSKEWTPIFGIGMETIIYKKNNDFARRIYPSAVVGFSYCPQTNLRHSGELWVGWIAHSPRPIGMNYLYFTKVF